MSIRNNSTSIDRSAWIVGDEQSLQNLYQDNREVARYFGRICYRIVKHPRFKPEDIRDYKLHLCEAYCLLWQNAETGKVSGRQLGIPLKIGTFAALFIDLCAADKVEIFKKDGVTEPMFRVKDIGQTDEFLEDAIFEAMRKNQLHGKLRETMLMNWLERAEEADCVESTFDNLVSRGILDEEKTGLMGMFKKYPTVNPQYEMELETLLKKTCVEGENPDSFIEATLVLSSYSDQIFQCSDPILKKHFTTAEYVIAKKNLEHLLKSYKV